MCIPQTIKETKLASYPGPSRGGGGESAWYTLHVHALAACGVFTATGCITIVIVRGFSMTCSAMWRVYVVLYNSIRLPHIFLGSHAREVCTRPFLLLKGLGTRLLL